MTVARETDRGTITIPGDVVARIVWSAAETIDGIHVRHRRSLQVVDERVRLVVAARRDEPLVPLAERVQEAVASALDRMCGLGGTRVDVVVEEVE